MTRAIAQPLPWSRVRHWLSDLTHEIVQGHADGSLPVLDLDRVWVGADDRVRLLDWPAPGAVMLDTATEPVSSPDLATSGRFLYRVAVSALRGAPVSPTETSEPLSTPLPLSARQLLLTLRDERADSADELASAVDGSLRSPATVTRSTRIVQLAICASIPVFLPIVALAALAMTQRVPQTGPEVYALKSTLDRLAVLDREIDAGRAAPDAVAERQAIETYVAAPSRHRREPCNVDAPDSLVHAGPPRSGGAGAGCTPESLGRRAAEGGRYRRTSAARRPAAPRATGDVRGPLAPDREIGFCRLDSRGRARGDWRLCRARGVSRSGCSARRS